MPVAFSLTIFAFSSFSPGATAGVAFHSIPVATTAQLVLERGFLGGDLLWRVLQPAFACREAGGGVGWVGRRGGEGEKSRATTNVMVRDMDLVRPDVHDTRRL